MSDSENKTASDFLNDPEGFPWTKREPSLSDALKTVTPKSLEEAIAQSIQALIGRPITVKLSKVEYETGNFFRDVVISDISISKAG